MSTDVRTFEQRLRDAGLIAATTEPTPPPRPTVLPGDPAASRYLVRAVTDEADRVRNATEGTRNHTLNAAAYNLGQLVTGAGLDRGVVEAELTAAAREAGLAEREIAATLRSGINAGTKEPRGVPELRPADAPALIAFDPTTPLDDDVVAAHVLEHFPRLDWHALWADEDEEEWIVEPLIPARRLIALYSAPKVGKSLLMLELAVAVSLGAPILGVTPDRPRRVLYVDFENDPKSDVRERLRAMGYGPDDLDNLCYLSFPTIAALDSPRGAAELLAAVRVYACELVVIDTVSRAIAGEENENDTWLAFYRNTGLALKKAQVALVRLDHSGKDETKGQRGGSAKSGDVDAVWRLSKVTEETYRLDCEASRMRVIEKTLVLQRMNTPNLHHRVDSAGRGAAWVAKVNAVVEALDAAEVPVDAGRDTARGVLKETGFKAAHDVVIEAQRQRRSRGRQTDWTED